jgi:hypothetical protein
LLISTRRAGRRRYFPALATILLFRLATVASVVPCGIINGDVYRAFIPD